MAEPTDDTVPAELAAGADADEPLDTMDRLLAEVAHAPSARPPLIEGDRVGRYVLVARLGAGGMGVVYAAYDPQLDRKVAVKVLRRELVGETQSARARDRTLREARALARLVHPNIVGVHDAGYFKDELYIVMELVTGKSLRDWLKAAPRTPLEIAGVFHQGALGLRAAHEAGMVHRDFKPDNLLVGDDGRVRVADFGLVQLTEGSHERTAVPIVSATDLTMTGAFMGTPGYMAPEQLDGADVDHRADQFAWGVSLWQALYGDLPWEQTDLVVRRKALDAGPPDEPAGKRAPAWLRAIVRRALSAKAADRYPDMAAVVRAIERGLGRRNRMLAVGLAVGGVAVVGAAIAFGVSSQPRAVDPCAGAAAEIAPVWSAARAGEIAKVMPSGAAGERAAADVRRRLDAYVRRWTVGHRDACRATKVEHTQSGDLLDRRMACLTRARDSLDTLIGALGSGALAPERALDGVRSLPDLGQCNDRALLAALQPWPNDAATSAKLTELEKDVTRVRLDAAGADEADALVRSAETVAKARALRWSPLTAEAALAHAELLTDRERYAEALPYLQEAVREAIAGGHDMWTLASMSSLAMDLSDLDRPVEAREWLELARAAGMRVGMSAMVQGRIDMAAWRIARRDARYADGLAIARDNLEASAEAYGKDSPDYASAVNNVAVSMSDLGRPAEAMPLYEEALKIKEAALGPEHAEVAQLLQNVALIYVQLGRTDEGVAAMERAMAIAEKWYGDDDLRLADVLQGAAGVNSRAGRVERMLELSKRAIDLVGRKEGTETWRYGQLEANYAIAIAEGGKLEEAYKLGRHALAVMEKVTGEKSPDLGNVLVLLGWVERARGNLDESARWLERALANGAAGLGEDHPEVANLRIELGHTEAARKRWARAVGLFERVVDHAGDKDLDPRMLAEARFGLAQALWDGGGDHARAIKLAGESRDGYAVLGQGFTAQRDEAAAWLTAHEQP